MLTKFATEAYYHYSLAKEDAIWVHILRMSLEVMVHDSRG